MASVGKVVTTSCLYDINDERIAEGANGATTTYPFPFYNVGTSSGRATYTKHIFANGEPVIDVQGSTTTAKVYYIHDDALGGANVLSNASGTVAEVIEYYPFGGIRFDQRASSTSFGEQRRFTGHEFDAGTGLNYMDARYEGPNLSRFLSEDPNFINAGAPDWVTGMPADPTYAGLTGFVNSTNVNYLSNPQNLSPYSYVNNNPLRYKDPDGKQVAFALAPAAPFVAPELLIGAGIFFTGLTLYDLSRNGDWQRNQRWAQGQIQNLANKLDISGDTGGPLPTNPQLTKVEAGYCKNCRGRFDRHGGCVWRTWV